MISFDNDVIVHFGLCQSMKLLNKGQDIFVGSESITEFCEANKY